MKWITLLLLLFVQQRSNAQKQFEGKIVYKGIWGKKDKEKGNVEVSFGNNAIQLQFKEYQKEVYGDEYVIVRFDSGNVYRLNRKNKDYIVTKLEESTVLAAKPMPKKIAGYAAKPIEMPSSISQLMIFAGSQYQSVIFVSDSLFYYLPEKYRDNKELIFVQNNRITLEVNVQGKAWEGYSQKKDDLPIDTLLSFEATEVLPMHFTSTQFSIPENYSVRKEEIYVDSAVTLDTMKMSESKPEPAPPPPPKKPASKKKPTTAKSPARKPE